VPPPAGDVFGMPLFPGATREPTQPVAGGREIVTYRTNSPWQEVADFYRAWVRGAAIESHAGGADWLEVTGAERGAASVQVMRDPGVSQTRILFYPRVEAPPTGRQPGRR
jgi:hypothetical protein